MTTIGIDGLRFYVPAYALDLADLARARGVPEGKFLHGLGQRTMAVAPPDQDVISMGASAAEQALIGVDRDRIGMVVLSTEDGVDMSKAGAMYLHRLLELPASCQAYEVKQACTAGTVALQQALFYVSANPDRLALVVMADEARYAFHSPAEATQGAGACALVISARPRIAEITPVFGVYTEEVADFWRPVYREEALVDGHFSIEMYMRALAGSWADYAFLRGGVKIEDFARFCCHLPFARIADKARARLLKVAGVTPDKGRHLGADDCASYGREIGNTYTASLYVALASLLETGQEDLAGREVGMYSYGSGCMGMFFALRVMPGYTAALAAKENAKMLQQRQRISVAQYEEWRGQRLPEDGRTVRLDHFGSARFRLCGCAGHRRCYERSKTKITPAVLPVMNHTS